MVKYSVEDTSLIAIADVIREKTSTTVALNFPSDFISAISSIEQGQNSGIKFATGTMTFNSNYSVSSGNGTEVKHNLGVVPDAIIIRSSTALTDIIYLGSYFGIRKNGIFNPDGSLYSSFQCTGSASNYNNMGVIQTSTNDFTSSSGMCVKNANTTSFYFAPQSNMAAKAGEKYVWYVIGKVS